MRTYLLALTLLLGLAGVASAGGKHHRYVGIHPIVKAHGGGMCHIEAPHVHAYAPIDVKVNFRDHDGYHHFVGDPVAYQWDGPKHAYYGHHPVPVHVVVGDDHEDMEYCYLDGAHYHAWEPQGIDVKLQGGAYWYVGDFPEAYVKGKVVYDPIDVVYKPIVYTRPAVVVDVPPPGWYGGTVVVAPVVEVRTPRPPPPPRAHAHGVVGVEVHVPTVQVEVGLPSVHIGVGGHVHGGHHHRHGHHKHKKWKKRGRGRGHDD